MHLNFKLAHVLMTMLARAMAMVANGNSKGRQGKGFRSGQVIDAVGRQRYEIDQWTCGQTRGWVRTQQIGAKGGNMSMQGEASYWAGSCEDDLSNGGDDQGAPQGQTRATTTRSREPQEDDCDEEQGVGQDNEEEEKEGATIT